MGILNIVKMIVFPKLICRCNTIPVALLICFLFCRNRQSKVHIRNSYANYIYRTYIKDVYNGCRKYIKNSLNSVTNGQITQLKAGQSN